MLASLVGAQRAAPLHAGPRQMLPLALALVVWLSGCAVQPGKHSAVQASQRAVVESYLAALNRRDVLALTAYVEPAFEWYSIVNGERVAEVASREELAAMLTRYFEANKTTRWNIEAVSPVGGYLAVDERSEWSEDGRTQSRNTLGVYELHDGRIRRVTYFLNGR